jgi:3-phenylpropionate/cinnamic acid dioxygenase small subunit
MVSNEDRQQIEDLLSREAHLLDERRFREWLDLFTEDVEYLMPLTEHVQGKVAPAGHPIIKDDKNTMRARVAKDETGWSHVETPVSMTCHLISNILVEDEADGEVTVKSSFMVRQARKLRDEAFWVGRRHDRVRRVEGQWLIARRCVFLDATVLPRGVSIFF